MSMDSAPASGYLLPFTEETSQKLNLNFSEYKTEIDEYLDDGESFESAIDQVLCDHTELEVKATLQDHTFNVWIFKYDSEQGGQYDDLDDGLYIVFDEDSIYERKYTPVGQALADEDTFPAHARWTVFG